MSEQTISLVKTLAARFPGLASTLDEHIKDNGEILPHVFFGDLTRYTLSLLKAANSGDSLGPRRVLREILSFLEEANSGGDEELQELIAVSFLENLPRPGEEGCKIRAMLGHTLSRQLHVIG